MISDLRWNKNTGLADDPADQATVDELVTLLRNKDKEGLKRFYEKRGETWDDQPISDVEQTPRTVPPSFLRGDRQENK